MQDNDYIQKIVSGESFEELEKILRGRIIELKENYRIRNYEHAKNLRTDIEGLIEKAKKAVKLLGHEVRLGKELKKYIQYNSEQFEGEEILELREEDIVDDSMMQRKEGSYEKHLYNPQHSGELLEVTIKNLNGKLTRSDLYGKLKQLRKDYYKKGKLNKEGVKELEELLEEAKKERMEFKDVGYSLDLFMKNIRKK